MRAYVPAYEVRTPKSLNEALDWLDEESLKPLAGGTDLMVLLEAGMLEPGKYLNIAGLRELRSIRETPEHIAIGALSTYSDIARHALLCREFPMLCQAAMETGALAIQNRGTIGGNIANASPAADSPPALLAYDAEIELVSAKGSRWMPYHQFHVGYKKMDLHTNELIASVRLPRVDSGERVQHYRKVGARRAQAIAKVGIAALAIRDGKKLREVRIAYSSVAPIPLRASKTERAIQGKSVDDQLDQDAIDTLLKEITPIDDIRSTAIYRNKVAGNLLREFLVVAHRR